MEPTKNQESFFDKNTTHVVAFTSLIPPFLFLYVILLLVNFHGKRKEISQGIFVGFALGMMLYVISIIAIGFSGGH